MSNADRKKAFEDWFYKNNEAVADSPLYILNFEPHEFVILSTVKGVTNSHPPRDLWPNVLKIGRVLQTLRSEIDLPLSITSGYRSPEYNRVIGGAERSQHMQMTACDITCNHMSPRRIATKLKRMRLRGDFKGGIGLYNTFVHVDVRGSNASW